MRACFLHFQIILCFLYQPLHSDGHRGVRHPTDPKLCPKFRQDAHQALEEAKSKSEAEYKDVVRRIHQSVHALNRKPPRLFPFCVGKDIETGRWSSPFQSYGGQKGIGDIIDDIQRKGEVRYDPNRHQMIHPRRIDAFNMFHKDPKSGTSTNFNHWLYLSFSGFNDRAKNIEAIYLQALKGPSGLPFGQFSLFEIKRVFFSPEVAKTSRFPKCTFYPRNAPTIPGVYVWNKNYPGNPPPLTGFYIMFHWIDTPCSEVAFFQFMIVIVKNLNKMEYEVMYSNIMKPQLMKKFVRTTHPLYPPWEHQVIDVEDDAAQIEVANAKVRIVSNLDFENCVQHGKGLVQRGSAVGSCPPEQHKCDDLNWPTTAANEMTRKNQLFNTWTQNYKKFDIGNMEVCSVSADTPPYPTTTTKRTTTPTTTTPTTTTTTTTTPTTTTTTTTTPTTTTTTTTKPTTTTTTTMPTTATASTRKPTPKRATKLTTTPTATLLDKLTEQLEETTSEVEKGKKITHGDLCILVWFVIIPCANYISRYFKEFPKWESLGLPSWIIAHFVLHQIAMGIVWTSFGLVVSDGQQFFGNAGSLHYLFGFTAIAIQHIELFNGCWRTARNASSAFGESCLHAVVGYFSYAMSTICTLVVVAYNTRKLVVIVCMIVVNILSLYCGGYLESKLEKRVGGIFPPRRVFPLLEQIVTRRRAPLPYKTPKILLFACITVTEVAGYFYITLFSNS